MDRRRSAYRVALESRLRVIVRERRACRANGPVRAAVPGASSKTPTDSVFGFPFGPVGRIRFRIAPVGVLGREEVSRSLA
jgi:hypothetical protein